MSDEPAPPTYRSTPVPSTSATSNQRKRNRSTMFTKRRRFAGTRTTRVIWYVRDIVCLPKSWSKNPRRVSIPRNECRNVLAESGLFGKILFDSDKSADDMAKEVC